MCASRSHPLYLCRAVAMWGGSRPRFLAAWVVFFPFLVFLRAYLVWFGCVIPALYEVIQYIHLPCVAPVPNSACGYGLVIPIIRLSSALLVQICIHVRPHVCHEAAMRRSCRMYRSDGASPPCASACV
jgi:hypothetical protein